MDNHTKIRMALAGLHGAVRERAMLKLLKNPKAIPAAMGRRVNGKPPINGKRADTKDRHLQVQVHVRLDAATYLRLRDHGPCMADTLRAGLKQIIG